MLSHLLEGDDNGETHKNQEKMLPAGQFKRFSHKEPKFLSHRKSLPSFIIRPATGKTRNNEGGT
jgi:hypothetical protein